ncbi:OpgC domain-containing protein [Bradyrhizobium sp.]|uniref:OpgC domain-containing protein n=1 Tax=Bradyrhizobium sp. TaxID=376 RepID=UPI004037612C
MTIRAVLPAEGRDLRLDLFRGIANWAIFLNHIPNIALIWITTRNYGFSDAAELFVFIAGYAAAIVYAKSMATQGFAAGASRLLERAWQLYVAHVVLFVINVAVITWVAQTYNQSQLLNEFNVARFIDHPVLTLAQGLLLKYKPFNLDILPLYIVLLAACPPVLWLMLRRPHVAIVGSLLLYFAARHFEWNLPAYPSGGWYFNPFTWQFLFLLGAWCALGGAPRMRTIVWSPAALLIGTAYLSFALLMTMAGRFETLGNLFPEWLVGAFNPNDKTNLAPYRIVHFIAMAVIVVRFMPIDWPGLKSGLLQPLIVCGQRSLEVFCVGLLLSFIAHFLLEEISASLLAEILVSIAGIGLMTGIAYYRSWSKRLEKRPRSPPGDSSDEAIRDVEKLGGAKIANRFATADSRRRSPSVSSRTKERTAKLTTN